MPQAELVEDEVIEPVNSLKSRVKITGSGDVSTDIVKKAEDDLKMLSTQFDIWIEDEVIRLKEARNSVKENGIVPPYDEKLYTVCHDMKGQAETLGYPLIAKFCGNLCKLFDAAPDRKILPFHIVDNHIDSVNNIAKYKIKVDTEPKSQAVLDKLEEVVDEYVEYLGKKAEAS